MVKHEDIPVWCEFGRIQISPRDLYFKNRLVVADKRGKGMGGFIRRDLSPHMVEIFNSLLKEENPKDLHKMTPDEVMFYNVYLRKANLHKKFPMHPDVPQDLKRRMTVLEGMIDAGNDNPKLKEELCRIAVYLQVYNVIPIKDLRAYLKSVKTNL